MAKSRDSEDAPKKSKAPAKGAGGPPIDASATAPAGSPADPPARSAGPTRRQVREIARLVGRLEGLGELEARRRRQLQVALEKGRKTRRHRQQVDRAVGRVGELIDRLRTLARELDSPVPAAPSKPASKPDRKTAKAPVPGKAPATRTSAAAKAARAKPAAARSAAKPVAAKPAVRRTPGKPASPRPGSKPADA
jgi:hypothetical protein